MKGLSSLRRLVIALAVLLAGAPTLRAGEAVDLALVLAVDVSGSVDMQEAKLQREGYIAAFSSSEVIDAITSGFLGKIAVTYFEWAGYGYHRQSVDWVIIDGEAAARAFAAKISMQPFHSARGTSISGAILWAIPAFDDAGIQTRRRVLDISGDGANNSGPSVVMARDQAVAAGITINGLPIVDRGGGFSYYSQGANLDIYYERCVIGGRNSFVIVANGFEDFADAVRQKLVLEISGRKPELISPRHVRAPKSGFMLVADRASEPVRCNMPTFN